MVKSIIFPPDKPNQMKKLLLFALAALTFSCSSDTDHSNHYPTPTPPEAEASIHGWWYRNANTQIISYKAYYFGEDGSFKQDMSNVGAGMGLGTWAWTADNQITMTPTVGGGIAGGAMTGEVFLLTNDSLVMFSQQLRLCKTNPN